MRTRRSPRNQDRLYRSIGRELAAAVPSQIPKSEFSPKPLKPIRELGCCCCGGTTRGRQWWNRDTGYGICSDCILFVKAHGETDAEIHDNYGVAGIHYNVSQEKTNA